MKRSEEALTAIAIYCSTYVQATSQKQILPAFPNSKMALGVYFFTYNHLLCWRTVVSQLIRIKDAKQSTMGHYSLDALHRKDLLSETDFSSVIDEFASAK